MTDRDKQTETEIERQRPVYTCRGMDGDTHRLAETETDNYRQIGTKMVEQVSK